MSDVACVPQKSVRCCRWVIGILPPPISMFDFGQFREEFVWVYQLHQILLFLVEHRASMKSFQALRSPAIPLTLFHDLVLLISSSIVLFHVLFGRPLLPYPWGFQSNAVFSIAPVSLHNVCPIQFHFLLFIWFSIDFWWVIIHNSSFVILSVYFLLIIHLKHISLPIISW